MPGNSQKKKRKRNTQLLLNIIADTETLRMPHTLPRTHTKNMAESWWITYMEGVNMQPLEEWLDMNRPSQVYR